MKKISGPVSAHRPRPVGRGEQRMDLLDFISPPSSSGRGAWNAYSSAWAAPKSMYDKTWEQDLSQPRLPVTPSEGWSAALATYNANMTATPRTPQQSGRTRSPQSSGRSSAAGASCTNRAVAPATGVPPSIVCNCKRPSSSAPRIIGRERRRDRRHDTLGSDSSVPDPVAAACTQPFHAAGLRPASAPAGGANEACSRHGASQPSMVPLANGAAAAEERVRYIGCRPAAPYEDAFIRRKPPEPPDMEPSQPEWSSFAHDRVTGGAYSLVRSLMTCPTPDASPAPFAANKPPGSSPSRHAAKSAGQQDSAQSSPPPAGDVRAHQARNGSRSARYGASKPSLKEEATDLLSHESVVMRERAYRVHALPCPEDMWQEPVLVHTNELGSVLGFDWRRYLASRTAKENRLQRRRESAGAGDDGDSEDEVAVVPPVPLTGGHRPFHQSAKSARSALEEKRTPASCEPYSAAWSAPGGDRVASATPFAAPESRGDVGATHHRTPTDAHVDNAMSGCSASGVSSPATSARGGGDGSGRRRRSVTTRDGRRVNGGMRTDHELSLIERVSGHSSCQPPSHKHHSVRKYISRGGEVLITPRSTGIAIQGPRLRKGGVALPKWKVDQQIEQRNQEQHRRTHIDYTPAFARSGGHTTLEARYMERRLAEEALRERTAATPRKLALVTCRSAVSSNSTASHHSRPSPQRQPGEIGGGAHRKVSKVDHSCVSSSPAHGHAAGGSDATAAASMPGARASGSVLGQRSSQASCKASMTDEGRWGKERAEARMAALVKGMEHIHGPWSRARQRQRAERCRGQPNSCPQNQGSTEATQ